VSRILLAERLGHSLIPLTLNKSFFVSNLCQAVLANTASWILRASFRVIDVVGVDRFLVVKLYRDESASAGRTMDESIPNKMRRNRMNTKRISRAQTARGKEGRETYLI